ncbi:hypothetical protein BGM19_32885 [Streptomyces agglomeratus]|uniref:hypothetical protein n=1 Tax=Streptomyces agglomeratus TaxID=285458 RepID=UPI000868CCB7|nr:hypothetical protein [Streptomyces agglomeratus]OEJ62115.1 hypothetical protein BGM19_32885 [Streptomyces agglomeratus]
MDLESVIDELYGLPPARFTAARNERAAAARTAGDRELAGRIQTLRRPTLSAWAGNLLVRAQPEQVQPLISLGEAMRRAHRDLDGGQLRELVRRQHDLVGALARQAKRLAAEAGHPVSEDVLHEIEGTLHAVLADPDAAQEWAAGHLTKPLSPPVGFTAATAPSGPAPSTGRRVGASAAEARKKEQKQEQEQERQKERLARLARAEEEATEAERRARDSEAELARAEAALREAEDEVATLSQQLKEAQERRKAAREETVAARGTAGKARTAAREARRRAENAARRTDGP